MVARDATQRGGVPLAVAVGIHMICARVADIDDVPVHVGVDVERHIAGRVPFDSPWRDQSGHRGAGHATELLADGEHVGLGEVDRMPDGRAAPAET